MKDTMQPPKKGGKNNERNVCHHHGTHPWSECSLNPQSRNYHMNLRSPFYRGGGCSSCRGDREMEEEVDFRQEVVVTISADEVAHLSSTQHTTHYGGSRGDNYFNDRGSDHGQDRESSGYNNSNNNYNYGNGGPGNQYDESQQQHNNNHGRERQC